MVAPRGALLGALALFCLAAAITPAAAIPSARMLDSMLGDVEDSKLWVLLVAGSSGYMNYRHQADVCHAYQIVVNKHGVPKEQVVTMLYNDVVKSFFNTRKGSMYNEPRGSDVYSGVDIDYSGKQITPNNFLAILRGDAASMQGVGTGRVIASGPTDRVFVYFADHGAPGFLAFPSKLLLVPVQLYARDLIRTLKAMHGAGKYGSMVLYVEACESGSVFNGLLPSNISAMAVTAAAPQEPSMACYYNNTLGTFLGDCFSNHWLEHEDSSPDSAETIGDQVAKVRAATNTSHVCVYGDLSLAALPAASFLGAGNSGAVGAIKSTGAVEAVGAVGATGAVAGASHVSSRDVVLESLRRQLLDAQEALGGYTRSLPAVEEDADEDAEDEEAMPRSVESPRERVHRITRMLRREEKANRRADKTFREIAASLAGGRYTHAANKEGAVEKLLVPEPQPPRTRCHGPKVEDFDCLEAAVAAVTKSCGAFSDYSLQYAGVVQRACDSGYSAGAIAAAAQEACTRGGKRGKAQRKGACSAATQADCDAGPACTWCVSAAVPSMCYTLAKAAKLPPAIFKCDAKTE